MVSKKYILPCIWLLVAYAGVLEFGGFSQGRTKILLLFFGTILVAIQKGTWGKISSERNLLFLCFLAPVAFLSSIYTHSFETNLLISLVQVYGSLVFFILLRVAGDKVLHANLPKYMFVFIGSQIFAACVKFVIFGQQEGLGVGTLSVQAGSISTFISVLICYHACNNSSLKACLLFILGATLFAFINEKRFAMLLVFTFALLVFRDLKFSTREQRSMYLLVLPALLIPLLLLFMNSIDSILEGNSIFAFPARVIHYLTQTDGAGLPIGRIAGILYVFTQYSSIEQFLFGFDPFFYFSSAFIEASVGDVVTFRPSAFVITFVRFGIFGCLPWFVVMIYIWRRISGRYATIFKLYVIFDFFVYSDNFFVSYFLVFYFATLASLRENARRPIFAAPSYHTN